MLGPGDVQTQLSPPAASVAVLDAMVQIWTVAATPPEDTSPMPSLEETLAILVDHLPK